MTTAVSTQVGAMPALPAHLAGKLKPSEGKREGANALITAGIGSDFIPVPRLSIEGKIFRVVVDGTQIPITKKDEDGEQVPVQFLNVVIVDANVGKYKTFYGEQQADGTWKVKKWQPGQEAERPICYSFDGERPSPMAEKPQCPSCKACPHNAWGSLINDQGNKTRACGDGKLLAVIPYSAVKAKADPATVQGKAYQLRVSATALSRSKEDRKADPASAHSLSEYVALLNNYPVQGGSVEVPVRNVVTRLFFGTAQYPLLQFKLATQAWLTEEEIAYVEQRAQGDDIKLLVEEQGVDNTPAPAALPAPASAPAPAPVLSAPAQTAPAPAAEPPKRRGRPPAAQPAPPAAAAPAPVSPAAPAAVAGPGADDEDGDVVIGTFGAPAAAAPAAAKPVPAQPTGAEMDNALAGVADLF